MKRIICIVIACIMIFTLAACGEVKSDDTLKIGMVCLHDENSPYDNNFITAFQNVCKEKNVECMIKTNISESAEAYEAASELADNGCQIVFADSFGHEDYIIQAAREFPNVEFCHATGNKAHTENLANYHNAFASIYEGRYLDGVAAGLKINEMIKNGDILAGESIVGYVGAYNYAEVISGYTAFYLGVKSVTPTARMKVVFTGSWYDETAEKEAANALIDAGCVLISGHADSMGLPNACEARNVPFVFYNGDISKACPNTFIVATKINWEPYFEYIIDCVKNGNKIDVDWVGGIENGSIMMTDVNTKAAAPNTEKVITETMEKIKNEEIHVFDIRNFTVNGDTVTSYIADVDNDAAYTGDTEVIIDNYFAESKFRSAPYFDLDIDGIELMT